MSDKSYSDLWTPSPVSDPLLKASRDLRRNMTDAERLLWRHLRGRQLHGYKFRRQHPVDRYVLDFYCAQARLAVEVDGGQHEGEKERVADAERSRFFIELGIRVLRFWNNEVLSNTAAVLENIHATLQECTPSPQQGEVGRGELVRPPGETFDDLRVGGLKIIQQTKGYRFSLDPILLCAFAQISKSERIADLGTGGGVIPLVLARRKDAAKIVGIERQKEMAARAQRSVQLNQLQDRIEILAGDIRNIDSLCSPQSFNVVVSNPPFRPVHSGRIAPDSERAAARHELAGGLSDFLRAAAWLLPDGGRFYIVFLAERLAELLEGMRRERLEPKRFRCVHGRVDEVARMVLVEGRKGARPGLKIESPLIVFENEQEYTAEVRAIYDDSASAPSS